MATAAQLAQLAALAAEQASTLSALEATESSEVQLELDGVNARLEAVNSQVAIALTVLNDTTYTNAEKLQLIGETLGPQS